jgi:hypothetical protein
VLNPIQFAINQYLLHQNSLYRSDAWIQSYEIFAVSQVQFLLTYLVAAALLVPRGVRLLQAPRDAVQLGPVHTILVGGDGSQLFSSQGLRSDGYRVYPGDDGRRGLENWPRPCGLRRKSGVPGTRFLRVGAERHPLG